MKVALVTHEVGLHDGQGAVNYAVVMAALQRGWSVTLVASYVAPDMLAMPNVHWVRIGVGRTPSALLKHQVFAVKSGWWLRRHRQSFDIVHVNGFITWGRADVNAAHFVHSGWMRSGYYPFRWSQGAYGAYQTLFSTLNAALEKVAFARAQRVVAVSDRVAEELRSAGVKGPVDVIYNGSDVQGYGTAAADRSAFGLPKHAFVCLFAGDVRISRKNLDTVLKAMVHLPDRIVLAVAGATKGSPYPAMVEKLGLTGRVHFLGHVTDMKTLMKSSDCLVFPSRYDPFALVVLEAMAAGLPVVTSATVGAAALVRRCGVVLNDPNDVHGLVEAVAGIEQDEAVRTRMRALSQEEAQHHSWQAMGNRYVDLYESLVAGRSGIGSGIGSNAGRGAGRGDEGDEGGSLTASVQQRVDHPALRAMQVVGAMHSL